DSLNCQLGQTLSPGTAVGEVVDTSRLAVNVWLPPRDAGRVKRDQKVRVSGAMVSSSTKSNAGSHADEPQPEENSVAGQVTFVGHIADPQTGNLPVQIVIDNSDNRFA